MKKCLVVMMVVLSTKLCYAQPHYRITHLGTLSGYQSSQGLAINDSGAVVGICLNPVSRAYQAFLWKDGRLDSLPGWGLHYGTPRSINNHGQVVGVYIPDTSFLNQRRGFICQNGVFATLPNFGADFGYEQANAINNAGVAVGTAASEDPLSFYSRNRAVKWVNGGSPSTLQPIPYCFQPHNPLSLFSALDINDQGTVVGSGERTGCSGDTLNNDTPYASSNGVLTILPSFRSPKGDLLNGHAGGINNLNVIVGDLRQRAVIWQNNTVRYLDTTGIRISYAYDVNDSGTVIGYCITATDQGPCIWVNNVRYYLNAITDTSDGWRIDGGGETSINYRGQIAATEFRNGQTRAILLDPSGLTIARPRADERWIAGEQDTIRWMGPGGAQLRIEFSDDNGATYSTVATNVPSDLGHYVWGVPPALSRRCKIILINIANDDTLAVSNSFKVKGYQLTRFRSDSSYEAFRPDLHGWRFLNTADTMWPGSWWTQFNYQSGTDPYTNELYPDADPFASAVSDDFIDWPLFVKSFTPSECYLSQIPPVYRPSAAFQWGETTIPYGGSCDGFAVSSLLAFDFEQAFLDSFPSIGTYLNLYDLPLNDERRRVINQLWEYQFGIRHLNYVVPRQNGVRPRQTLAELKSMLISESGNHQYLRAINQDVVSVHALIPYRLERDALFPGFYNVFVYDCNHPGNTSSYVVIDSINDEWEYPQSGYGGDRGLFLMDSISTYLVHPDLGDAPTDIQNPGINMLRIFTTVGASISIGSSNGQSIEFEDSTITNTLIAGTPIIPSTSRYQPPIGYYIPAGTYSIRMSSFTDSLSRLSVYSDSLVYSHIRHDASPGQTDRLSLEMNGLGLRNPDAQSKLSNFKTILIESGAEKVIDVVGYAVGPDDSAFYGVRNHDHLRLVNTGNQKQYTLKLHHARSNGQSRFLHTGITIPANSSQEVVPVWANLGQPVTIYTDFGNNGTIDDTLIVGNTLGVDDRDVTEIPKEYSLAQNYPNPFNPSTRIEYALPHASRVRLTVYNVLGQLVATLVDEDRPAGRFAAEWNGSNVSSGVYFYRLEVTAVHGQQTFRSLKKMLLLK